MQYSFCITFYLLPGQCIYIPTCSQTFNFEKTSLLPKDMMESGLLLLILPKGLDRRAKIFIRTADSHILSEMSATFSFPVGISCQVFKQLVYFGLASQQNLHDLHAHQLSQNLQWADSSSKLYTYIIS